MRRNNLIRGGLLLIVAALCLTGYNLWEERQAEENVRSVLQKLEAMDTATLEIQPERKDKLEPTELPERLPLWVLDPETGMPVVEIEGSRYIGTLELPALGLTLPVLSDWSAEKLKLAPCRYLGSAEQGDLIIAAHNYRGHFAKLKELSLGDIVIFTDMAGGRFEYQVVKREQLDGRAIEEMEAGEWNLTLFTCTIGGKSRVTVRCNRQE